MKNQERTVKRLLPCELTDEELKQKSKELSNGINEEARLKQEKAFMLKQMGAKTDEVVAQNKQLAEEIGSEREYRQVIVKVITDYSKGVLREIRTDTGEEIESRELTDDEKQTSMLQDGEKFEEDQGPPLEDEMYKKAVDVVLRKGKASTSLIQRSLKIGYAQAARIVETMEQKGIIGPADGSKPREVL